MKTDMQLSIPKPCHEDWNTMTITQQGRYCNSCCKQVVDFTTMSDVQIIEYLSKTSQKICGRFNENQLVQPVQSGKRSKQSYWRWIIPSFTAIFLFFSCKSKKPIVGELQPVKLPNDSVKKCNVEVMGDVYIPINTDSTSRYPSKKKN